MNQIDAKQEYSEVIFVEELSLLIGKTASTIRTCATNQKYQHLIPRPSKFPGSRRLYWRRADVIARAATGTVVKPAPKRGRPTKQESLRRT